MNIMPVRVRVKPEFVEALKQATIQNASSGTKKRGIECLIG